MLPWIGGGALLLAGAIGGSVVTSLMKHSDQPNAQSTISQSHGAGPTQPAPTEPERKVETAEVAVQRLQQQEKASKDRMKQTKFAEYRARKSDVMKRYGSCYGLNPQIRLHVERNNLVFSLLGLEKALDNYTVLDTSNPGIQLLAYDSALRLYNRDKLNAVQRLAAESGESMPSDSDLKAGMEKWRAEHRARINIPAGHELVYIERGPRKKGNPRKYVPSLPGECDIVPVRILCKDCVMDFPLPCSKYPEGHTRGGLPICEWLISQSGEAYWAKDSYPVSGFGYAQVRNDAIQTNDYFDQGFGATYRRVSGKKEEKFIRYITAFEPEPYLDEVIKNAVTVFNIFKR